MKNGSKSKDLGRKFGFSLLNFVVVFFVYNSCNWRLSVAIREIKFHVYGKRQTSVENFSEHKISR